ncbi:hypothetical protein FrEUN1fDRAFT_1116 [Parafrankia sp. EUN1f]|nr:hypothetical protein FrEUN1fDRAFT_1116 [Parafrankia sp. EUN1f]
MTNPAEPNIDAAAPLTAAVVKLVTATMAAVVSLTFLFGFGNVLALGLRLGVPIWVAPLVAPAVDLSVLGLLGTRHLAVHGGPAEVMRSARRLLIFSSTVTLALNIAEPLIAGDYGKAAFDAVGPLLLIGWSEVGPGLLQAIQNTGTHQPSAADHFTTQVKGIGRTSTLTEVRTRPRGAARTLPSPGRSELRPQVTEHQLLERECGCGTRTKATPPAGVDAPVQYGPRVTAAAVYLYSGQFLSKDRTATALAELDRCWSTVGCYYDYRSAAIIIIAQASDRSFSLPPPDLSWTYASKPRRRSAGSVAFNNRGVGDAAALAHRLRAIATTVTSI